MCTNFLPWLTSNVCWSMCVLVLCSVSARARVYDHFFASPLMDIHEEYVHFRTRICSQEILGVDISQFPTFIKILIPGCFERFIRAMASYNDSWPTDFHQELRSAVEIVADDITHVDCASTCDGCSSFHKSDLRTYPQRVHELSMYEVAEGRLI